MVDLPFRRLDVAQVDAKRKALFDEKLTYPLPVSDLKDQNVRAIICHNDIRE